jgi:hypothetical protein
MKIKIPLHKLVPIKEPGSAWVIEQDPWDTYVPDSHIVLLDQEVELEVDEEFTRAYFKERNEGIRKMFNKIKNEQR